MKQKPKPTSVTIQSNVPVPRKAGSTSNWPFQDMKIGDSFYAGPNQLGFAYIPQAAMYFSRKHKEYKFTTRREGGGMRVWRIPANNK